MFTAVKARIGGTQSFVLKTGDADADDSWYKQR
jgi:hypothetical protein